MACFRLQFGVPVQKKCRKSRWHVCWIAKVMLLKYRRMNHPHEMHKHILNLGLERKLTKKHNMKIQRNSSERGRKNSAQNGKTRLQWMRCFIIISLLFVHLNCFRNRVNNRNSIALHSIVKSERIPYAFFVEFILTNVHQFILTNVLFSDCMHFFSFIQTMSRRRLPGGKISQTNQCNWCLLFFLLVP